MKKDRKLPLITAVSLGVGLSLSSASAQAENLFLSLIHI